MGLGIPPLKNKIMFESNPLKSIMLVGRLAACAAPAPLSLRAVSPGLARRRHTAYESSGVPPRTRGDLTADARSGTVRIRSTTNPGSRNSVTSLDLGGVFAP